MSKNRDLLKEAIADAKSVKETAIANAKLALEEAFTPHLKSMMSAQLQELDEEMDKEMLQQQQQGQGPRYRGAQTGILPARHEPEIDRQGSEPDQDLGESSCDPPVWFEAEDESENRKVMKDPGQPTKPERQEHWVHHWPYRSWCPHCLSGRALASNTEPELSQIY